MFPSHNSVLSTVRCVDDDSLGTTQTSVYSRHSDPFMAMSRLRGCVLFINHLFACPDTHTPSNSQVNIRHFIEYSLHRTKVHSSLTFAALVLLQDSRRALFTVDGHALLYNTIHHIVVFVEVLHARIQITQHPAEV
ncbi:hypothetical protein DFJ58DRAFT_72652 [Suillus subalutaceus]|uniref:uncharacterized protein n=1 Tax=Suillus subalutaceus TaxID=48586 RepID=UPI001B8796EB|nr:uncharacterized protein DFJ58DRAFT_72652 [Suillus subalutaceus]KAG1841541.1 hypothetical protein DFJ58DRAFT_72652 [Suillus subalutaceus]